jgi:hypothetical protein
MRWFYVLFLILSCWLPGTDGWAGSKTSQVSLDLFAFRQVDGSGDPIRNQSFSYGAVALAGRVQVTEVIAVRGSATLAYIGTDLLPEMPKTVTNASVTTATPDTLTLDSVLMVEFQPKGTPWLIGVGAYYHHQFGFIGPGCDLLFQLELFGGDTVLHLTYSMRPALVHWRLWDDRARGEDFQFTNNFLLGWTQVWSPQWVSSFNLQYVRQDGQLRGAYRYVGLVDDTGDIIKLIDEDLPRMRNRLQGNVRVRFSPRLGLSFGVDLSGYFDDWDILHGSFQVNVEIPVMRRVRLRLWYRLAAQRGTRYFTPAPTEPLRYLTQDSDLASFVLHAPGMMLLIPIATQTRPFWAIRISLIGFYRTDGVFALGANTGVVASW